MANLSGPKSSIFINATPHTTHEKQKSFKFSLFQNRHSGQGNGGSVLKGVTLSEAVGER